MHKYFSTRFGPDPIIRLDDLRKEFPGFSYKSGMRKGVKGIWIISDIEYKDSYGEPWECDNHDWYYPPNAEGIQNILNNLQQYQTDFPERTAIKLACGLSLNIYPASAIPRKALFSKRIQDDDVFNRKHEYGAAAYDLYFRAIKDPNILINDPQFVGFIKLALKYSYNILPELWDALEILTYSDYDKLFAAAVGVPVDEVEKKSASVI